MDDGVQALADMLTKNSTLKTLDLSSNQIQSVGAHALATALRRQKTLTESVVSWLCSVVLLTN